MKITGNKLKFAKNKEIKFIIQVANEINACVILKNALNGAINGKQIFALFLSEIYVLL